MVDFCVVRHVLQQEAEEVADAKPAESQPTSPADGVHDGQEGGVLTSLLSLAPTVLPSYGICAPFFILPST